MATRRITSTQSSPTVTFFLDADVVETDLANRRWKIRFYMGASKSTSSFQNGAGNQTGTYNGNLFGSHNANPFLPLGSSGWYDGPWEVWVYANAQGYWNGTSTTLPLAMGMYYEGVNTAGTGSIELPQMGTVPPPPIPQDPTPDQITATSMRFQFNSAGDGGSPIIRWEYQYSTSPTFASGNSPILNGLSGTVVPTGMTPGTTYYFRVRGVNGIGTGAWTSGTWSGTTLTGSAPGMLVTPSLDGQSASVALTPPPEIPSPSSYKLEYRIGTGAATQLTVTTPPVTVSPLVPGTTYQWRAAAVSGAYTGPYTAWTPVAQPLTNTNPGDYFDGSTAAKTDTTFGWLGTVNNSMSRAIGKSVTGWGTFESGNTVSGGAGVVYRVTGGRSQQFAARVDFWTPTTVPGFHAGIAYGSTSAFPALQGAVYDALIHVRPSRTQRLAAMLVWVNNLGVEVARTVGNGVLVAASADQWAPLRVSGTPPFGATRGSIRVIDVAGAGWSTWKSGDTLLLDDAITPFAEYYFDGNTPDVPGWDYQWDGAVNASPSRRVPSSTPIPNPLIDPDCPPVPPPPRPPQIADSCVEEDVTEWRRFWQEIPAIYVPTWIDSVPILKIETESPVRLVRVRYYPNPFNRPLSALEPDSFCSEQIISYIPGGAIFTLDGVSQHAFAELSGSSNTLAADHLLRGDSNLWPVIGCGSSYYVTVDVPTDTPSNAVQLDYSLVQRY